MQTELYESRMKQATCLDQLGRDPVPKLQEAARHDPQRAEPFTEIAKWHGRQVALCSGDTFCEAEHHMAAYLYAKKVRRCIQSCACGCRCSGGPVSLDGANSPAIHCEALQAVEIPLPLSDGGLYHTKAYGPLGHGAEILAVHAFSVALHSKGVFELGIDTAQKLATSKPQDERLKANLGAWQNLRAQFKKA